MSTYATIWSVTRTKNVNSSILVVLWPLICIADDEEIKKILHVASQLPHLGQRRYSRWVKNTLAPKRLRRWSRHLSFYISQGLLKRVLFRAKRVCCVMFDDALFMAPPNFDQKRGRKNPFDLAIFELNSKCEISRGCALLLLWINREIGIGEIFRIGPSREEARWKDE